MQLMEGRESKVLFLLNKLTPKQRVDLERRNIDLHGIIASVVPDNETAGYEMAQSLFAEARRLNPEAGEIRLLSLTGDSTTPAGLQRELGMLRAVADNSDVKLVHAIPVDWSEELAFARTKSVLNRTRIDVVWGANDDIAFGAQRAATDAGLNIGKDILFAGLNWSNRGMNAVRSNELTMTHGGHFFAGAWAIVMLRDHFFRSVQGKFSSMSCSRCRRSPPRTSSYISAGLVTGIGTRSTLPVSANRLPIIATTIFQLTPFWKLPEVDRRAGWKGTAVVSFLVTL